MKDAPIHSEGPNTVRLGRVFFWKKLENAFNKTYCELFLYKKTMIHHQHSITKLVGDDFKMYFKTILTQLMGLKISQHVCKNCQGPVMPKLVQNASGLIVGIHFEMKDDTTRTSTKSIIKTNLL